MKCREVKRKLSAYMDGELDLHEKKMVETHLQSCAKCQHELKILKETWEEITNLPLPDPVPYFYTRLKVRMEEREKKKRLNWVEQVLIPASAVAVIALGVFIGSTVSRNGNLQIANSSVEEELVSSLYLNSFDDFPNSSLGEVYIELTSQE